MDRFGGGPAAYRQVSPDHFGSHFPSKIDERIDAKIDTEKVMKFDENSMRKWTYFLIFFKRSVHVKTNFFENGEIVYTLAGCSRMHVGEGLQKKIKSKNEKNIKKFYSKKGLEKEMVKV